MTQTVLAQRRAALLAHAAEPRTGRDGGLLDRFDERLPFTLTDGPAGGQPSGPRRPRARATRCTGCCRARSAPARPSSRCGRCCASSTPADRRRCSRPTEVLAQQHHRSITAMLGDLAAGGMLGGADRRHPGRAAHRLAGRGRPPRGDARRRLGRGRASSIGTHALLEEKVQFADLGLVVVDEQHRFGVEQRAALTAKSGGTPPHVLVMTATPIPRTVAMTVFGDLETSTLRRAARRPGADPDHRRAARRRSRPGSSGPGSASARRSAKGHQVYVVCPRIGGDDDDGAADGGRRGRAARLAAVEEVAPDARRGTAARPAGGDAARPAAPDEQGRRDARASPPATIDVLVSTTVIEVGVDVANATMMVVLDADRFGVSQLHQLRGRVGRGGLAGAVPAGHRGAGRVSPARERLDAVAATTDGFELSRVDLEQRREGDVLGASQSGRRSSLRLLHGARARGRHRRGPRGRPPRSSTPTPTLAEHPTLAAQVRRLHEADQADYLEKA